MPYYEEVIQLVIKTDQANAQLAAVKRYWEAEKAAMEAAGFKVQIKAEEFKVDLNKLVRDQQAIQDKARSDEAKAQEKARANELKATIRAAKERAAAEQREAKDSAREFENIFAQASRAKMQAERARSREERLVAVELYRYRREMDEEEHRRRMAHVREQSQAQAQAAKFNSIFTPGGRPLPVSTSSAPASSVNVSAGLRAGAGAAGAIGAYPAAGVLYATANAMQLVGKSTLPVSTALLGFGSALAVVGGVYTGYKFIEWGLEFNRELARMSTLLADASVSGDEFQQMLDKTAASALKLSAEFNMDKLDVVKAFKEALSSGIDASDLERFTRVVATFATATSSDLQSTTNLLTSIKDSYRLSIGEMTEASDILFDAIDVGKLNVGQLNMNFGRLSGVAAAAGIELKEVAGFVALLTRQGMTTANAITSVIQTINGLQNPSEKAKKALMEAGVAIGDTAFRGKNLVDVFQQLKEVTGGSGDIIGSMFDEERARRGVTGAIRGVNLYKQQIIPAMEQIGTSAKASERALNNLADNFGKRITEISNTITNASSKTGGWLNELMFGKTDDEAKRNAALVDRINKFKAMAVKKMAEQNTSDPALLESQIFGVEGPKATAGLSQYGEGAAEEFIMVQNRTLAEVRVAIETAYAEAKDAAVKSLREIDEEVQDTLTHTAKMIKDMSDSMNVTKMGSKETRAFNSRITDEQKDLITDLEYELELRKELLKQEEDKQRIQSQRELSSWVDMNITPVEDRLATAVADNDAEGIRKYSAELEKAKKQLEGFAEILEVSIASNPTFGKLAGEVFDFVHQIETMRARILTQDDREVRQEKEKAEKESLRAQEKQIDEFASNVEKIYNQDVANYKKAQDEKKKASDKLMRDVQKNEEAFLSLQKKLRSEIIDSQMRARADDPRAQGRLARSEREDQEKNLRNIIDKGGSRAEFDAAANAYLEAAQAVRNAMGTEDERRANRNYQEDINTLGGLNTSFNSQYKDAANADMNEINKRMKGEAVRSPEDIATAAARQALEAVKVEKVMLDAKIDLQVDGTLSKETEDRIAASVIKKIQAINKNKNYTDSNYDPKSRNPSTVINDD